jgi:hypothetical protein
VYESKLLVAFFTAVRGGHTNFMQPLILWENSCIALYHTALSVSVIGADVMFFHIVYQSECGHRLVIRMSGGVKGALNIVLSVT